MLRMCSRRAGSLAIGIALLFGSSIALHRQVVADDALADPAAVEFFEKKVRPILVARCHECHAGDKHKGNLRLDSRAAVVAGGDTGTALVAGDPEKSLLVDAVRYGDLYQMPPDSQLPPEEIKTLEEWVRLGAPWGAESADAASPVASEFDLAARSKHWSFQPLAKTTPPQVAGGDWVRTPVDRFLLQKLEAAGLEPTPPADRRTLLRRVTFDLTGLPPTAAEIEAFVGDEAPNAYEKVVNRLLGSPHYGERWARHWLDLVRFAETHGHEFDFDIPNAYRYRDYVIRAINADLPYDQFVIEHVAGDLLTQPRRNPPDGINESIVATGWYFFGEAVHSPVDVRADEAIRVDNQIDVFSKTFLGLTVSCARCHDHKFDAISTKDYYALAGYLQSSRYQQAPIDAPQQSEAIVEQLTAVKNERRRLGLETAKSIMPQLQKLPAALKASVVDGGDPTYPVADILYAWNELNSTTDGATLDFSQRRRDLMRETAAQIAAADATLSRPAIVDGNADAEWQPSGAAFSGGLGNPLDLVLDPTNQRAPIRILTVPTAHSGLLSTKLQGVLRSPTFEITGPKLWYRVYGSGGKVRLVVDGLQLIRDPIYGGLEFAPTIPEPRWHEQNVSKWIGHRAYVELVDDGDGYLALEQLSFSAEKPADSLPNRAILAMLDDATLTSPEALGEKYRSNLQQILSAWLESGGEKTLEPDKAALIAWLLRQHLTDQREPTEDDLMLNRKGAELAERQREIEARITPPQTTPAMVDGTAENEHVFVRGNHKTLGDEVPRRFLEVLGGVEHSPPSSGSGRLELARQLVSPECPLVPRVIVNRLWHHHFGSGLVRSPDDFGVMGQPPTHPELLDYLATELVDNGWSLKHLHRLMVLSNAYRMASQIDPAGDAADPQNKLWHRMAVRRLEAEAIRDAVLFVSGELKESMFGPGVMPHLTEFMAGRGRPGASGPLDGDGRRSIYLAVRRNFLSPMFLAFDYPTPFTTIGRRGTSNVPAQALSMMNNPFVIEQASKWADRVLSDPAASRESRIRGMYTSAFGREPDDAELQAALVFVSTDEKQSWADYAHVLLNVKEFIYIP